MTNVIDMSSWVKERANRLKLIEEQIRIDQEIKQNLLQVIEKKSLEDTKDKE